MSPLIRYDSLVGIDILEVEGPGRHVRGLKQHRDTEDRESLTMRMRGMATAKSRAKMRERASAFVVTA